MLCADVLNCCFGSEGIAVARWEELKRGCERWDEGTPSSFTPIYIRDARKESEEGEREAFPEIWHSHACHSKCRQSMFTVVANEISYWCPAS